MKKITFILFVVIFTAGYKAQCWKSVVSKSHHSLAIKFDGTLWAWGENGLGEIGDSTVIDRWVPTRVGSGTNWKFVAAGNEQSLGIKTDGTLWGWGSDAYGQSAPSIAPKQIGTDSDWEMVSTGSYFSMGIKTNGTLWGWGDNQHGEIGDGTNFNKYTPVQIGNATNWKDVSAGISEHCLAVKTDGTLWSWGYNYIGQLGDGTTIDKNSPAQIGAATNWKNVTAGEGHSIALKTDGTLWAWGDNGAGQLGDGTTTNKSVPTQIGSDNNWNSVCAGAQGGVAIKTNGSLWAWGTNICVFCSTINNVPQLVGNTNWQSCSAGVANSFAIKADGTLWTWGYNARGELANGTADDIDDVPTFVPDASKCDLSLSGLQENSSLSAMFKFFPNPASKELHINALQNLQFEKLLITDISGKIVLEQNNMNPVINVENFQKGIYFLTLQTGEGTYTDKFIKE